MTVSARETLRRLARTHGRRAGRRGILVGAVVLILLAGTGVSYANWRSSATAESVASTAALAVTTQNFDSNQYLFQNHRLVTTGRVDVANTTETTSATAGDLALTLDTASDAAGLAGDLRVRLWPATPARPCSPSTATPPDAKEGTWAAFPVLHAALAAGDSVGYCIRTFAAERGDLATPAGTASLAPRIRAVLTVGNYSATATATTGQETHHIHPAFAPVAGDWYFIRSATAGAPCLDVYSNGTTSGTPLIHYPCKSKDEGNLNQQWRFTSVGPGYFDLQPRHATGLRWDNGGSTGSGAAITLKTAGDGQGQDWQLQRVASGVYQLVNRLSGLCLLPLDTDATTAVEYSQAVCDGSTAQHFTLTVAEAAPRVDTVSCADTGTSGTGRRVTCTVSPTASGTLTVQAARTGAGSWESLGTIPSGSASIVIDSADVDGMDDGQYALRFVAGDGTVLNDEGRMTVATDSYRECVLFVFCHTEYYQYPTAGAP